MKRIVALLVMASLLSGCTPNKSKIPDGYKLFFEDEFEGTSLNTQYWSYETGNNNGWGNGEVEYYQEENAVVNDLYTVVASAKEEMICEDHIHLTPAGVEAAAEHTAKVLRAALED